MVVETVAGFMNRQNEHVIFIQKLNNGVYCIDIKGTDYIFQTYEFMYECVFELFENGYYLISNTSPVIERMYEQWNKQIFINDRKLIIQQQLWYEEQ
jgi:hypothetical protein